MREYLIVRDPVNAQPSVVDRVEADSKAAAMYGQDRGNMFVCYYAVTAEEWREIQEAAQ